MLATAESATDANSDRFAIEAMIKTACWHLDTGEFDKWIGLFAADGVYEIEVYSPEIQKSMRWQRLTRMEMATLLSEMPNHLTEDARRAHMVMTVQAHVDRDAASSISRFVVFKTNARGESGAYAIGTYVDDLVRQAGVWLISRRKVVLETRMFDVFPHIIPL